MVTKLIVASGKSAGRSIAIKRNKLLIGRAEECDVRPLSEEVSRRHCAVIVGPADVWVQDLGSRNGTFVNGERIEAKTKLSDGDLIRVGSLELKVSCSAPAAKKEGAEDDVSRWLMDDEAGTADTTRTLPAATSDSNDGSFIGGMMTNATEPADAPEPASASSSSLTELKELKAKPGTLPAAAAKKSDSSRDAAADALKKFFDRK
jgi:pSer/pThr/pTyr-binding forkhead associated (FHA) protein